MNAKKENPKASVDQASVCSGPLDVELEFLWEAQDAAGDRYNLYLGQISRNPVVRSHTTGKYFMLPWSEIIATALKHGIGKK